MGGVLQTLLGWQLTLHFMRLQQWDHMTLLCIMDVVTSEI